MASTEEKVRLLKGLELQKNRNGFWVIFCHYSADPDKDPERNGRKWYEEARKGLSQEQWEQEYEINFFAKLGKRVFPEFNKEIHVRDVRFNRHSPLYIGWDFGFRHPAVVFCQTDTEDRLLVLREILGEDVNLYTFIEEFVYPELRRFGIEIRKAERRAEIDYNVISFCDPAGVQRVDSATASSVSILREYGFKKIQYDKKSIEYGIDIIHRLLRLRPDGTPGMYVNPSCKLLIEGFLGGYHYRDDEETPEKDGLYDHLFDALRYLVIKKFRPVDIRVRPQKSYIVNLKSPTGY